MDARLRRAPQTANVRLSSRLHFFITKLRENIVNIKGKLIGALYLLWGPLLSWIFWLLDLKGISMIVFCIWCAVMLYYIVTD